jgi:hypothetical protein
MLYVSKVLSGIKFYANLDGDGVNIELDVPYQYKANAKYLSQLVLQFKIIMAI